jgi:prevent-host-death family protein
MAGNIVGARELKVRLGTYLGRVRRGQRIVVTDRGQPVAELRPISGEAGVQSILVDLEARGIVARPSRKKLAPFRLIESRGNELSMAVVDDRGDRF